MVSALEAAGAALHELVAAMAADDVARAAPSSDINPPPGSHAVVLLLCSQLAGLKARHRRRGAGFRV